MNIAFGHWSGKRVPSGPVLAWAVVLAATLLSFYVHLLNEQMHRVAALRAMPAESRYVPAPGQAAKGGASRAPEPRRSAIRLPG